MAPAGDYNPLFERFVKENASLEERLRGYIAYAIYKQAKREWVSSRPTRPGESELKAYVDTWTPSRLDGLQQEAERILEAFGDAFVETARPGIREEAIRGTFGRSVWAGVVSAFLYSLIAIGFFLILKYVGVDLIALAQSVGSNR